MVTLNLAHEPDAALQLRAAWLYYMAGLTQEEVARRLGLHRTRVVRLLAEARERGLVSVTIHHEAIRDHEAEQAITDRYGLDFCLATPPVGLMGENEALAESEGLFARRAVGSAAASFLRGKLLLGQPITVGVSWGRTLEQMALHLAGVRNEHARFVSLMGSLTRNSASNPFEVVQALAVRTGGEGHFLPVPFIADSPADRAVLLSQRTVTEALALAGAADLYLISVGELSEAALLHRQGMLSEAELRDIRARGAVCDTLGRLFDAAGRPVEHSFSERTLAVDFDGLRGRDVVLLAAGRTKAVATRALLRTGLVRGLILDGDLAAVLTAEIVQGGPPW